MADIGNMYTDLILPIGDLTNTQRVVEVFGIFGVDGTGEHFTEVLTTTNLLWGDARIYFLSSLFNMLRIFVRESVLCQDGMHLHIVVALLTQHVNHFAHDVLGILRRPLRYLDDCLVAGLSALQLLFRYQDVVYEDVTLSHQEGIVLLHLQLTNSLVHLVREDLNHHRLLDMTLTTSHHSHLHTVAVQSEHGVTFRNEDRLSAIIRLERILAVGLSDKGTFLHLRL